MEERSQREKYVLAQEEACRDALSVWNFSRENTNLLLLVLSADRGF